MINLREIAFKEGLYATDGIEVVRTVPTLGTKAPFIGFIKTTVGEAEVLHSNKTLNDVLVSGRRITEEEYLAASL